MIERIGKYGILERVGVGGQGTVYRAQDPDLNRIVALKVMNQAVSIDDEYIDALRNEAQIAARLAHPNIATVYDFLIENDQACIVMEYVPSSLNLLLLEQKNIPIERVIEITEEMGAAFSYAHEQNLIHRDIKPQNILLTDEGAVKVTDFGIARAISASVLYSLNLGFSISYLDLIFTLPINIK